MTITQAAAPTGTAVTIAGTVRTPLTLVRRLTDRQAVSYTHLTLPTTPYV